MGRKNKREENNQIKAYRKSRKPVPRPTQRAQDRRREIEDKVQDKYIQQVLWDEIDGPV